MIFPKPPSLVRCDTTAPVPSPALEDPRQDTTGAVAVAASSDTAQGMKRTRASPCQSAPAEMSDDDLHEYCEYMTSNSDDEYDEYSEYDEYGAQSHYFREKKSEGP